MPSSLKATATAVLLGVALVPLLVLPADVIVTACALYGWSACPSVICSWAEEPSDELQRELVWALNSVMSWLTTLLNTLDFARVMHETGLMDEDDGVDDTAPQTPAGPASPLDVPSVAS